MSKDCFSWDNAVASCACAYARADLPVPRDVSSYSYANLTLHNYAWHRPLGPVSIWRVWSSRYEDFHYKGKTVVRVTTTLSTHNCCIMFTDSHFTKYKHTIIMSVIITAWTNHSHHYRHCKYQPSDNLIIFLNMELYFLMSFTINVTFLHEIIAMQWIFNQYCGHWCPGA